MIFFLSLLRIQYMFANGIYNFQNSFKSSNFSKYVENTEAIFWTNNWQFIKKIISELIIKIVVSCSLWPCRSVGCLHTSVSELSKGRILPYSNLLRLAGTVLGKEGWKEWEEQSMTVSVSVFSPATEWLLYPRTKVATQPNDTLCPQNAVKKWFGWRSTQ